MAYTPQFKPQPIGIVTVLTPGTPVQVTFNLPSMIPKVTDAVTDQVPANKVSISTNPKAQAGAGNTGNVYIGQSNMSRTTLFGVIAVLTPGGSWSWTNNVGLNIYQLEKWYVDADNAGDGIYGSFDTV